MAVASGCSDGRRGADGSDAPLAVPQVAVHARIWAIGAPHDAAHPKNCAGKGKWLSGVVNTRRGWQWPHAQGRRLRMCACRREGVQLRNATSKLVRFNEARLECPPV